MALETIVGPTILAGQSLSDGVNVSGFQIIRIILPDDWTAAPLSFQVSPDGDTYHNLQHIQATAGAYVGYETTVSVVTPKAVLAMPINTGELMPWVKIRSGTSTTPVKQAADRVFKLELSPLDAGASGGVGAAGATGPTGPAGPEGPEGQEGLEGAPGAAGPAGPAGSTGAIGPAGASGAVGTVGPTGASGAVGVAGATGPTGPMTSKGVTDGSAAVSGDKGEYITANSTTPPNLVTLVTANVASISLPPGDWDIWGAVIFQPTSTGPNSLSSAISGVSATLPSNTDVTSGFGTMSELWASSMPSGKRQVLLTGQCTSNLATAKTVYLVAQASFGGGSVACSGYISARRAR